MLHEQLCKQKSGTIAQTQIESLPDITVEVWLVQLLQQWVEAGKISQEYLCANTSI